MKSALTILILIIIPIFNNSAQPSQETSFGNTIITREMIRESGISLLSDIFRLIDHWDIATVDGFDWQAVPVGHSFDGQSRWRVLLDGQKIDIDIFGSTNINRLPVTLDRIDYIEVISVPQISQGEFLNDGLINIHTNIPADGFTLSCRSSLGNKTGDPGPYINTDLTSSNVLRLAENYTIDLSYRKNSTYFCGGIWQGWHFPTDSSIKTRNNYIADGDNPVIEIVVPSIKIGRRTDKSNHELYAGCCWLDDFFFFTPLGREVPVKSFLAHSGVNGSYVFSNNTDINYDFTFTTNKLNKKKNPLNLDFDWQQNCINANIEASRKIGNIQFSPGISMQRYFVSTDYELTHSGYTIGKIYSDLKIESVENISHEMGFSIQASTEHTGFNAYIRNNRHIFVSHSLTSSISCSFKIPEQANRFWYWTEREYSFLQDNNTEVIFNKPIGTSKTFTGDISWRYVISNNLISRVGIYYKHFENLILADRSFYFNPDDYSFYTPSNIITETQGQVGGYLHSLEFSHNQSCKHRLHYRYQKVLGGSSLFRDTWQNVPTHKVNYTISCRPDNNFTIKIILDYRSSCEWYDYREIDIQTNDIYNSKIGEFFSIDVVFQKWFWHRKLRTNLFFRNILNDEIRYHPIGASFDLSWFFQIELMLHSYKE